MQSTCALHLAAGARCVSFQYQRLIFYSNLKVMPGSWKKGQGWDNKKKNFKLSNFSLRCVYGNPFEGALIGSGLTLTSIPASERQAVFAVCFLRPFIRSGVSFVFQWAPRNLKCIFFFTRTFFFCVYGISARIRCWRGNWTRRAAPRSWPWTCRPWRRCRASCRSRATSRRRRRPPPSSSTSRAARPIWSSATAPPTVS